MKKWFLTLLIILSSITFAERYNLPDLAEIRIEAENGDALSMGLLGECYYRGEGVDADPETGIIWLEKAAEMNDPYALYNLGLACRRRQYIGNCHSYFQRAYHGLRELAESRDARAQNEYASMLRYGLGVNRDQDLAFYWNKLSAEQGFPRALYHQAMFYYYGTGVERDYNTARFYLEKLPDWKFSDAEILRANMLYNGHGYERDLNQAAAIFAELQNESLYLPKPAPEDELIANTEPPAFTLVIEEGSCGEACLWSVLNGTGKRLTQIEINQAGGDPGRGLRADELFTAMDSLGISYKDLSGSIKKKDLKYPGEGYHQFLYDKCLTALDLGHPVLIGVKVYPTDFPHWPCDHFILLTGYNRETDEFIFNDFQRRKRIPGQVLINPTENGYSLDNKFDLVFGIEFTGF